MGLHFVKILFILVLAVAATVFISCGEDDPVVENDKGSFKNMKISGDITGEFSGDATFTQSITTKGVADELGSMLRVTLVNSEKPAEKVTIEVFVKGDKDGVNNAIYDTNPTATAALPLAKVTWITDRGSATTFTTEKIGLVTVLNNLSILVEGSINVDMTASGQTVSLIGSFTAKGSTTSD